MRKTCEREHCDNKFYSLMPNKKFCNEPDCIKLGAIESRQAHLERFGKKCGTCHVRIHFQGPKWCSTRCEMTHRKNERYAKKIAMREQVKEIMKNPIQAWLCHR